MSSTWPVGRRFPDTWDVAGFRIRAFPGDPISAPDKRRTVISIYIDTARVTGNLTLNVSPSEARGLALALTEAAGWLEHLDATAAGGSSEPGGER
jgi:hypothetical protein